MDYQYFDSLSTIDAEAFLGHFLETECKSVDDLISKAGNDGIKADFSIESLAPVLCWIYRALRIVPQEPDESLPGWIKECISYKSNLFDFDGESKVMILRGAYYLGETFVRSSKKLYWSIGNQETAVKNMPVVRGFRHGLEMAPMLVVENVYGRIFSGAGTEADIETMISYWLKARKN